MTQHHPNLVLPPLHCIMRPKTEDEPPAPQKHIVLKTAVKQNPLANSGAESPDAGVPVMSQGKL
jgi:hypothetical protein